MFGSYIQSCTFNFEFHIHAISKHLIHVVLCKVSIVEAIENQNKDAYRFAVLTVL